MGGQWEAMVFLIVSGWCVFCVAWAEDNEVWTRAAPSEAKTSNTWLDEGFWLSLKHKLLSFDLGNTGMSRPGAVQ